MMSQNEIYVSWWGTNPLRIEAEKSSKPESVFFSPSIFNLCFIVHFVLVFSSSSDLTWCHVSHSSFLFASLWTCNSLVRASKIYFPFLCIFSVLFFSRCFSSMMHHNGVVILVFTFFFVWCCENSPPLRIFTLLSVSLFFCQPRSQQIIMTVCALCKTIAVALSWILLIVVESTFRIYSLTTLPKLCIMRPMWMVKSQRNPKKMKRPWKVSLLLCLFAVLFFCVFLYIR